MGIHSTTVFQTIRKESTQARQLKNLVLSKTKPDIFVKEAAKPRKDKKYPIPHLHLCSQPLLGGVSRQVKRAPHEKRCTQAADTVDELIVS